MLFHLGFHGPQSRSLQVPSFDERELLGVDQVRESDVEKQKTLCHGDPLLVMAYLVFRLDDYRDVA